MPTDLIQISKTAVRALVACALLTAGAPALAAGDDWRCWYNAPEHVSCMPQTARARVVSPQRFLHIPLHTIPFDMEGVRTLAQSVVCGRRPDCRMAFTQALPTGEELDLLMDPLLAQAE